MLIKNGTVVTPNETKITDILVKDGKIIEISNNIKYDGKIFDATGFIVMPGAIDVHTHFDLDVGIAIATDDFETGSIAAAHGGTTTIVDHMGFGPKNCDLHHQFNVYKDKAKNAVIDYSFHGVIQHINDDILSEMEELKSEGISSFKFYMTYGYKLDDYSIFKLLKKAKELDIMITFHPENDGIINYLREDYASKGLLSAEYHPKSRPEECESEAINRVLKMASIIEGVNIYVVHLSSNSALKEVRNSRNNGYEKVFVETCPQYLVLDDSLYSEPDGLKYIMSPPLRDKTNNELLMKAILDGEIQTIGTDHCPFNYNIEKQQGNADFRACPNGAPGVELRPILMYSELVEKRKLNLSKFVDLVSTNPAKLFGMYPQKGLIAVGSDADFFIVDPSVEQLITHGLLHENVDYTPFEGIKVKGKVFSTILRGEVIVENQEFLGTIGQGNFVSRNAPNLSVK